MALATFSAIIDFALKAETMARIYFTEAGQAAPAMQQVPLLRFKTEAEKNVKTLQTILREQITEMVMEPCEALDEAAYAAKIATSDPLATSRHLLEQQRDFLRRAAQVINLREVKRAFDRLADRKQQLIAEIS